MVLAGVAWGGSPGVVLDTCEVHAVGVIGERIDRYGIVLFVGVTARILPRIDHVSVGVHLHERITLCPGLTAFHDNYTAVFVVGIGVIDLDIARHSPVAVPVIGDRLGQDIGH